MSLRPPSRVGVTRHGEKEQKLRDFILQYMASAQDAADGGARQFQIVARSVTSPVVQAVASLEQQIAGAGYGVRMILAQVERETLAESRALADRPVALDHEIRWARHPTLIEAHEQLVLGPQTCWIGDSMRRDPAKCDAFESFVEGCGEAAGCASVSFERLWFASERLPTRSLRRSGGAEAAAPMPPRDAATGHTVGTRH